MHAGSPCPVCGTKVTAVHRRPDLVRCHLCRVSFPVQASQGVLDRWSHV